PQLLLGMATIYSGFHVKLKSPLTPWSDRLKLARFAWASRQCFLPNKEQVLFDWVSHALSCYYNKKVQVPLEVVEDLWTYLDEILHSKKLYNVLNQGKTITLNPSLAKIINERILESTSGTLPVSLSIILSCCHGILTSPVLSVTYTASYELLVKLLATVCGLACFQLKQQGSPEPLQLKVFEVLFLVLNTYLTVQRQQGNANRVFAQVTEHLFQPLCLLRHLLTTRVWTEVDDTRIRQQLKKDIRNKVDTILQSALFHSDHLSSYKEVLPSENKSGARKEPRGKPLLCPVSTIVSKLVHKYGDDNEALFYAVRSSSLPLLFKMALDSFCKREENKLLCFHFMTKLITALEFTEDLSVKETFKAANWSLALLALENILNCCLSADVYNVAADRIHHREVQFNFFRKVAKLLLNNTQTGIPAWYRCLKNLLALNHQILEPDLDELISSVWVDADNMELRVKKARETLVSEVLQTYSKLRQLPRLIEELLGVIDRPAAYELRQALLPQVVQKSLSQCLLNNPPRQNLEICMLILEKMQNELPYVAEMRAASALKLFSLGILLHAVIFSLKALDDSTPVPIVRQTQSLMENMLTFLRALLQNLEETLIKDSICGEKIQETSLLLTHTWHEADALFQIHCSKYTSSAGLSNDVSPVSDAIEKVLTLTGSGVQVISPLTFYSAAITTKETDLEDLYSEILKSIHKLLSSVWLSISEVKELEAPVKDLLAQLVVNCSQEQFRLLLLMFQEGLVATKVERGYYRVVPWCIIIGTTMGEEYWLSTTALKYHFRDVLATVALIKLLAGCPLPLTCSKAFWAIVPQIISSLVFVVRESREVATLTSSLIVPVVDTLTTLLRQGESWLSNPHNIILVLGALHFVPLENQSMEDYYSAFQAIHEALFAIILCYPKIMLKSAPTFLNCFYRLVTSIIHEGKQKGMNEKEKDSEKLLKCARLVERMYTHIGKTAEGFSILSSFMVAQYVNELQKVTLRPEIKAHLTEGIYCILDQCIENDIKFLNRTLQKGLKEVFDELYKNYTRYHKSQWQGEEKYTA
ncbi:hypothetical protein P4O66_013759, partial [Electrophorus voltai]